MGNARFHKKWHLERVWKSEVHRFKVAAVKLFQHTCLLFRKFFVQLVGLFIPQSLPVVGRKGHNISDISFPGSPVLQAGLPHIFLISFFLSYR